jgi:lipoprotein-anchoring transpeptidase ErfK/SrfK
MPSRRQVITGVVGVAAGTAMAGCASAAGARPSPSVKWVDAGSSFPPGGSVSATPVAVTFSPAADTGSVVPGQRVVVTATGGTLRSVTVAAGGRTVAGAFDADQRTWRSTGELAYAQTYTITASVLDASGATTQKTSSFTTLRPAGIANFVFQANALAVLNTGGTYGIGQIPIVRFSRAVGDEAAAEQAVRIETSPWVPGKFFWLDRQTLHWRPEHYFQPGTKVTVTANMLGVHLGNNVYGARNASTNYTIGPSHIAIVDSNTHMMQVLVGGQQVKSMPCSIGKGGYTKGADGSTIDFFTRSGPHVVLERDPTVRMTSSSYGITNPQDANFYDESVRLCLRISYSGEYTHLADWNIPDHGHRNTSHGCINLNPDDAQWMYDNWIVGDIVDVRNTPVPLPVGDGLGDWAVPWSQYGH